MKRFLGLNTYFKNLFGCRVHKLTVDAGLTCPNRDGTLSYNGCIYCNDRGSGTGAALKGVSITDQLLMGKERVARRFKAKKFLAYFQSYTNTYAPLDRLKAFYDEALSVEDVIGLAVGTRPDCVYDSTLELLEGYAGSKHIWLEYGLQSCHDKTLTIINRGHDFDCFAKAVEKTAGRGIRICAHVILGLPGEDRGAMLDTARALASLPMDGVKLHLLYVVRGTELARLYEAGEYRCMTREEYADAVCGFLELIPETVVIQRLTGDPHPHELVAPLWALEKRRNLEFIAGMLEERDVRQGCRL